MNDISTVESRLVNLEKQNKRFRRGFRILIIIFLAPMLMGNYKDNRIYKNNFVVVDKDNRARATFGLTGDEAALALYGKTQGAPVVHIRVKGDNAAIVIQDPQGNEIWRAPERKSSQVSPSEKIR